MIPFSLVRLQPLEHSRALRDIPHFIVLVYLQMLDHDHDLTMMYDETGRVCSGQVMGEP